ncbi:hypothetical protein KOW87_07750, partial [Burkholderia semiarida]|nr:hypothetical protein [Burkholderia semiarida]
ASQRSDCTCCRVRHGPDETAKPTRRTATSAKTTERTGYRTNYATKPASRIANAAQGARHRTDCAACRVAHRPDNAAETAGPATTDTTQCASQRSDCTCCRVRHGPDETAKPTRRTATSAKTT